MKKYFIFSDVHSFYDELMSALKEKGFDKDNSEHIIISCGDATDRGKKPKQVLKFLLDMYSKNRAYLVLGNHEDLINEIFARGEFFPHDKHNGSDKTVLALAPKLDDFEDIYDRIYRASKNKLWLDYMLSCKDYVELGNYIFVHGWIPLKQEYSIDPYYADLAKEFRPIELVYNPEWRQFVWGDDWKDARWCNGMKMWSKGIKESGKTIVCGHWHCSWGNAYLHNDGKEFLDKFETCYIDPDTGKQEPHVNWEPFIDSGIIALDACTALTKKVNVLVLTEEELYK